MKKILCAGIVAAASLNLYAAPLVFNWQQHQAEVTETIQSADQTIKTRYRIRLLPRNPDYAPIEVAPDQDFAIEGLYCGLVRPNR